MVYFTTLYYTALYQLEELLPLRVVLQGEQWDSVPHSLILAVNLLVLPLGLLVDHEVVLVQALEVGYHAPIVQLPGSLFPPRKYACCSGCTVLRVLHRSQAGP